MKLKYYSDNRIVALIAIITIPLLSSCKMNQDCTGYTGAINNQHALALINKCHFLSRDSIEQWTNKYQEYKNSLGNEEDSVTRAMDKISGSFLRNGSVSFNSCLVKKMLCNSNSIGLRVLYGIGPNGKMHIILVGIQPDYSNLYVEEQDCCSNNAPVAFRSASGRERSGKTGGAEYGQIP